MKFAASYPAQLMECIPSIRRSTLRWGSSVRTPFAACLLALSLTFAAHAAPGCGANAEGSAAYVKAAEVVRRLPEFQSWSKSHNHPVVFGAPMDKEVLLKGQCYWSVSVFADRRERLEPWHIFFVRPSGKSTLVQDPASGEPISLAAWRNKNASPTAKP